jgi:diaminopimelate epimerase
MEYGKYREIEYCVLDPTGNITALVESAVDVADQPAVASRIMELEPDVEQVGFITYAENGAVLPEGSVPVSLRMAGGEFCGNATMCAAALFAFRRGLPGAGPESLSVPVKVSGASKPLHVSLERQAAELYSAAVSMPPALAIEELNLAAGAGSITLSLPLVKMEGISHIIAEPDSGLFGLKDDPATAEALLKDWCSALNAECLGLMFLDEDGAVSSDTGAFNTERRRMIPLVYVPGADTMFWENSCASGSAAAGMYLAAKAGRPVDVTLDEPAGRLRVESDPSTGKTVLHGSVAFRLH